MLNLLCKLYMFASSPSWWLKSVSAVLITKYQHAVLESYAVADEYSATVQQKSDWLQMCYDTYCNDVIMRAMASQITSLTIVYSNVYSDADQRKHQSSASLFFTGTGEFPTQMASARKMFPFDDVMMDKAYGESGQKEQLKHRELLKLFVWCQFLNCQGFSRDFLKMPIVMSNYLSHIFKILGIVWRPQWVKDYMLPLVTLFTKHQ